MSTFHSNWMQHQRQRMSVKSLHHMVTLCGYTTKETQQHPHDTLWRCPSGVPKQSPWENIFDKCSCHWSAQVSSLWRRRHQYNDLAFVAIQNAIFLLYHVITELKNCLCCQCKNISNVGCIKDKALGLRNQHKDSTEGFNYESAVSVLVWKTHHNSFILSLWIIWSIVSKISWLLAGAFHKFLALMFNSGWWIYKGTKGQRTLNLYVTWLLRWSPVSPKRIVRVTQHRGKLLQVGILDEWTSCRKHSWWRCQAGSESDTGTNGQKTTGQPKELWTRFTLARVEFRCRRAPVTGQNFCSWNIFWHAESKFFFAFLRLLGFVASDLFFLFYGLALTIPSLVFPAEQKWIQRHLNLFVSRMWHVELCITFHLVEIQRKAASL